MSHEFSEDEISAVGSAYPQLALVDPTAWQGSIDLNAIFNGETMVDSYEVSIAIPEKFPEEIPILSEVGGRTQAIAAKYDLNDLKDLHRNIGGSACVCVKQEERKRFPPGSTLVDFINDLAVPYLYGLSYFDEHGHWPWGEYAHGGLGLLEGYADDEREKTREDIHLIAPIISGDKNWKEYRKQFLSPSPNRMCMCGKGKPIATCHPLAWSGLLSIKADIKRLGLNPYKLFSIRKPPAKP